MSNQTRILVTGGAGYKGAILIPKLLAKGYRVRVFDLYLYGEKIFDEFKNHPGLEQIKGDIRDADAIRSALRGCSSVIHLACISNDPSCDLDPELTKSVNYDAFVPLVQWCKESGVRRFVFASSSSVYGISDQPNVDEDHPRIPITAYNKYKAMCEDVLLQQSSKDFVTVIIRPATVCGYSPRQRLDLTVNILTNQAMNKGVITVFGGNQMRPNIHIEDITDLYVQLLELPERQIAGKVFNAGYENHTVMELANMVRTVVQKMAPSKKEIQITTIPSDDIRSYHISTQRIRKELGFVPKRNISDAVRDLIHAFQQGKLPDSLTDIRYYNIKLMQTVKLT